MTTDEVAFRSTNPLALSGSQRLGCGIVERSYPRVGLRDLLQPLASAVGAAIIHDDDFGSRRSGLQKVIDQHRKRTSFVQDRQNQRDSIARGRSNPPGGFVSTH